MAVDRREKNANWLVRDEDGQFYNIHGPILAVLMDVRDELRAMQKALLPLRHLECHNFLTMPQQLKQIAVNTAKTRRKKAKR